MKKQNLKAVLVALSIVLVLSLASVFGQAAPKSQPMNGNMMGMMNMGNMMQMMKDMGMSDDMMEECQGHMKEHTESGMMQGMMSSTGMSQEEHESHHR